MNQSALMYVQEPGTALVTTVVAGSGAGNTYGNAILDWTGSSLTLSSESASSGELVFRR